MDRTQTSAPRMESVHAGPFGNSKFLNFVYEYYRECSTILDVNPDFQFVPEHERPHGVKVFWLKASFNDYWQPTLQGEGPHAEKQYMDFIKKVYSIYCTPMLNPKFTEPTSSRWCATPATLISRRPSKMSNRFANISAWIHRRRNRSQISSSGELRE